MEQIRQAIRQMIVVSEEELDTFLENCTLKTVKKKTILNAPGTICHEILFINRGILREMVVDHLGVERTTHFALENQFIAEYASFLQQSPTVYTLQALEDCELVVLPRKSIEWGYANLKEGDKMGRLIAEFYFIYLDKRIKSQYTHTPKARYDAISQTFPNIHNRVPQHMIASYLGISPVHLSRLKRTDRPES